MADPAPTKEQAKLFESLYERKPRNDAELVAFVVSLQAVLAASGVTAGPRMEAFYAGAQNNPPLWEALREAIDLQQGPTDLEMFEVLYGRQPRDAAEFDSFIQALHSTQEPLGRNAFFALRVDPRARQDMWLKVDRLKAKEETDTAQRKRIYFETLRAKGKWTGEDTPYQDYLKSRADDAVSDAQSQGARTPQDFEKLIASFADKQVPDEKRWLANEQEKALYKESFSQAFNRILEENGIFNLPAGMKNQLEDVLGQEFAEERFDDPARVQIGPWLETKLPAALDKTTQILEQAGREKRRTSLIEALMGSGEVAKATRYVEATYPIPFMPGQQAEGELPLTPAQEKLRALPEQAPGGGEGQLAEEEQAGGQVALEQQRKGLEEQARREAFQFQPASQEDAEILAERSPDPSQYENDADFQTAYVAWERRRNDAINRGGIQQMQRAAAATGAGSAPSRNISPEENLANYQRYFVQALKGISDSDVRSTVEERLAPTLFSTWDQFRSVYLPWSEKNARVPAGQPVPSQEEIFGRFFQESAFQAEKEVQASRGEGLDEDIFATLSQGGKRPGDYSSFLNRYFKARDVGMGAQQKQGAALATEAERQRQRAESEAEGERQAAQRRQQQGRERNVRAGFRTRVLAP